TTIDFTEFALKEPPTPATEIKPPICRRLIWSALLVPVTVNTPALLSDAVMPAAITWRDSSASYCSVRLRDLCDLPIATPQCKKDFGPAPRPIWWTRERSNVISLWGVVRRTWSPLLPVTGQSAADKRSVEKR